MLWRACVCAALFNPLRSASVCSAAGHLAVLGQDMAQAHSGSAGLRAEHSRFDVDRVLPPLTATTTATTAGAGAGAGAGAAVQWTVESVLGRCVALIRFPQHTDCRDGTARASHHIIHATARSRLICLDVCCGLRVWRNAQRISGQNWSVNRL